MNFKVEYSGELMFVLDFYVFGKKNLVFEFEGWIMGVFNLSFIEGCVLFVGENISSVLLKNKVYIEILVEGKLMFGVFKMEVLL